MEGRAPMIALGIELSTACGSVALLRDDATPVEVAWLDDRPHGARLPGGIREVLARGGVSPNEVDLFVAGRGPGSYTGMRLAMTAIQGLATPGHRATHALSSGEALAAAVLRETDRRRAAVIGDARRQRIWIGVFERDACLGARLVTPWRLMAPEDWSREGPRDALVVSPELERLDWLREQPSPRGSVFLERTSHPTAVDLTAQAICRVANNEASEPRSPLYLHPPVFVPPSPVG